MSDVTSEYLWLVIFSSIVCIGMAWGIGAIDVATSVASGIGAKAFTLKQAVFIILIFEFAGAALLGGKVTETVRTKITDYQSFAGQEDILMLGMTCSLLAATIWLYVAAKWEVPISSAHSIIGGIVGFVLVAKGPGAVVWDLLAYISVFWVVSPALTAGISVLFFVPMRAFLLRRQDSWEHTLRTWPVFVFIVVWIGAIFLFLEGWPMHHAAWMSTLTAAGFSFVLWLVAIKSGLLERYCERAVAADQEREEEKQAIKMKQLASINEHDTDKIQVNFTEESFNQSGEEDITPRAKSSGSFFGRVKKNSMSVKTLEVDVHDDLDDLEAAIHKHAEKFDPRVEKAFSILQLASASLDNFAHGSNDVANAVAPLASIWSLYETSEVRNEKTVPFWMIACLIAGMIVGLSTYGYRVVKSLGVKMTCLTNTRGYGTELSSAVLVIFASYFGFPASSAHVQVGAIVGTGIAEKVGNKANKMKWSQIINWKLLGEMFASWILTIVCAAMLSAGLFTIMAYSPYLGNTCH